MMKTNETKTISLLEINRKAGLEEFEINKNSPWNPILKGQKRKNDIHGCLI